MRMLLPVIPSAQTLSIFTSFPASVPITDPENSQRKFSNNQYRRYTDAIVCRTVGHQNQVGNVQLQQFHHRTNSKHSSRMTISFLLLSSNYDFRV